MPKIVVAPGRRFGRLVAVRKEGKVGTRALWVCQCDCGAETRALGSNLTVGDTTSCGCRRREGLGLKHGHNCKNTPTPTYSSWRAMHERCRLPSHVAWKNYGGRGIRVCARWAQFENFLADMGERPEGLTLDRIDVNGDYEPENCQWATRAQQVANRRTQDRAAA